MPRPLLLRLLRLFIHSHISRLRRKGADMLGKIRLLAYAGQLSAWLADKERKRLDDEFLGVPLQMQLTFLTSLATSSSLFCRSENNGELCGICLQGGSPDRGTCVKLPCPARHAFHCRCSRHGLMTMWHIPCKG